MSKGTEKLSVILKSLKKLPASRRSFWLKKINSIRSGELGAEPKIIQMPTTTIVGTPGERDWLLDTANWLDSVYIGAKEASVKAARGAADAVDEATLKLANRMDAVSTAILDEAKKLPKSIGKGIGDLTGTGDYWPYLLGASVALGAVYYFTQISPIRRLI